MELLDPEIERIGYGRVLDWSVAERTDFRTCWYTNEDWPGWTEKVEPEERAPAQGWREIFECVALNRLSNRTSAIKRTFAQLETKWRNETAAYSLTYQKVGHIAYMQIIGLGQQALPYIFDQLRHHRRYWFVALEAITRDNPVQPGSSFDEAVDAWLEWGGSRGYLTHVAMAG